MPLSSRFLPLVLLNLLALEPAAAYSVLTHEAIIDSSWPNQIKPLLLKRFPTVSEEQLREAHGYAYGGAIIQDMGYYPFGSKFLSDLLHYVRSGEFIAALLRESQDIDEYAFALGALAHYASDNEGHPIAVNRVVPMLYPKLRAKYGPEVTYEDDPAAHLKTEFAFDVVEVAGGKYASQAYHDFIGFQVSKALLERGFKDTYSLELNRVLPDEDLALGTYRYTVSKLIPEMTKTAWSAKKKEILQLETGMTRRRFVYRLPRASYHRDWDKRYQQPGPGARFLAWLLQILPKVGPLQALAFKVPTPDAEKLFLTSVADTRRRYLELIDGVNENALRLQNENFDIGRPTRRGEYRKADESYEKLLEEFADSPNQVSDGLRADILRFYGQSGAPSSDKAGAVLSALRGHAAPAGVDR